MNWIEGILEAIYNKAEYLRPSNLPREYDVGKKHNGREHMKHNQEVGNSNQAERKKPLSHILFVTPSAAGPLKPDQWIISQGDKALQVFEKSVHSLIHGDDGMFYQRGMEHMGTWNMSIQMEKWDGVHLDLRGNLLKAMGVINWLGGIETELW